jgi:hypothetical protein
MEASVQSYYGQGIFCFTFGGIIADKLKKDGTPEKRCFDMPNWRDINTDNFNQFCLKHHKGLAVLTGKISNITAFDFDDKAEYNKLVEAFPDIKKCRTIQTNKGYHVYCLYNESVKTTTNALLTYQKVDVRNDSAILYAPPTKYKLPDGSFAEYKDLGGAILPIPTILLNDLKQNQIKNEPYIKMPEKQENIKSESSSVKTEIIHGATEKQNLTFIQSCLEKGYLDNKADAYDDWRDVGFIIKHTSSSPEAFELFDKFSQINKTKYEKEYTKKFWDTIKQSRGKPLTIATMKKWVKDQNKKDGHSAEKDNDVTKIVYEELKDTIKYCNNQIFIKVNNIWIHDMEYLEAFCVHHIQNSNIFKSRDNGNDYYWGDYQHAKNAFKSVLNEIILHPDNSFYNKFHSTTKGKLCFLDGVLDLESKHFYEWEAIDFEYYSCVQIKRNYKDEITKTNENIIEELQEKILKPLFGNKLKLALQFFSRAIAGHNEDKNYATYLGNRDCGKGVIYDLLKETFENYVKTFALDNVLCGRESSLTPQEAQRKLYWLLDYEHVRLAISQETPDITSNLKINSTLWKKMNGGGDTLVARRNYDRKDTYFYIDTSFFCAGNNYLQMDGDLVEHLLEFESFNQFKSKEYIEEAKKANLEKEESQRYPEKYFESFYIADPTIKDKVKQDEYKNAFIHLLMMNYQNKACEVKIAEESQEQDSSILSDFLARYEITKNNTDKIPISIFDKSYFKNLKKELQRIGVVIKKNNSKDELRGKYCIFGVKHKEATTPKTPKTPA